MSKFNGNNIVDVWNWLIPILQSGDLNATEQIVLVHLIAAINRNLWKPTKYNPKIIAATISKDTRTVNSAIKHLVQMGIISSTKEGFDIVRGTNFKANEYDRTTQSTMVSTDTARLETEGRNNVTSIETANRQRQFFK